MAGGEIGRYRIVSQLGAGGMGEVYDAVDSTLGRHVAIKVLKADAVGDPKRLSRFIQEARAAAALNHPHLVSIYEIGEHRGRHFIAMERVDGVTLREMLARERPPLVRALDLMAQTTEAVAAAHGAGIIHRDLKPENIMVSRGGYAKVLDFGLAKLQPDTAVPTDASATTLAKPTESGIVLGTVGYMSPEQAQGKPADARSDIFALGCILYEAITGRRAFHGDTSIDTLHKIIHEEPTPLCEIVSNVPAEVQRIVRKAMTKNPDERYQLANDLALDLRILARESGPERPSRPADEESRRRTPVVLIAIGTVAIVVAVMVVLWQRSTRARPPASIAFQRVTSKGNLATMGLSPDGRFIAYSQEGEGGQSLWLRQLASGEDLQLVPPAQCSFWGAPTFTSDGSAIVYGLKSKRDPRGSFYRMSTIGGPAKRLLSGIDSAPSFSPDGRQMTWVRAEFPTASESALMVANSDGTGARVLARRRYPELFAPIYFTHPSWSPDGKLIAASVKRVRNPDRAEMIGVDPRTGRETLLSKARWVSLSSLTWLPDQSGIVAIGATDVGSIHPLTGTGNQIWLIPYPSGEPRRITHDILYYRELSISADGERLLSDVTDAALDIWRKPLSGAGPPQKISSGHFDGNVGLSATSEGQLVFSSRETEPQTLWIMDAHGGRRRPFLRYPFRDSYPVAFSGGIAYVSATPAATELCTTNRDGEVRSVVVSGIDEAPIAASPNGKWLVCTINRRLWKFSADGRERQQLSQEIASTPAYSPKGDQIAFLTGAPGAYAIHGGDKRMVVIAADGHEVWSSAVPQPLARHLRWTNDGNALLLFDWHDLWLYPLRGQAKKLTSFDDNIWSFDVAPDQVLFIARGSYTRDAVLITGFR